MKNLETKNILILMGDLNYTCGVTTHLYNFLSWLNNEKKYNIYLICSGGDRVKDFRNIGIYTIIKSSLSYDNRSIMNFAKAFFFILKFIQKNKIKLIHSQNHYVANIAFYVSKFVNAETIQSHHNLFFSRGRLNTYVAKKHIVVSERIRQYLIKDKKIDKKRVTLIRYGIKFDISDSFRKSDEKIIVIAASRFIPEKGLDVYLTSVSQININTKRKASFILAGAGKEEEALIKINQSLSSPVNIMGKVEGLLNLLRTTNIFIMSSKWESEGFPLTLIEAAMTNNFVITSNFPGVEEIFEDQKDGFIFDMNNSLDLKKKLSYAIENYDILEPMITHFNKKINSLFNFEIMAHKLSNVYEESFR